MEHVKEFLESSSIHGLSWISRTRRYARLFWILVILLGITGAGYLINLSFTNWGQNPITTTIETLPISQIKFPNVTVCLPKNSILDLNYDFEESKKVKFDNNTRKALLEYTLKTLDVFQHL